MRGRETDPRAPVPGRTTQEAVGHLDRSTAGKEGFFFLDLVWSPVAFIMHRPGSLE